MSIQQLSKQNDEMDSLISGDFALLVVVFKLYVVMRTL